ncbi:MAG: DnaJ family domain-containing protein [Pseudooceanicola sp.]
MIFNSIIDEAFKQAQENGDLDNLPGAGKPIAPSSLNTDPFAHVYKEAEVMTPFAVMQGKIDAARTRLAAATDPEERRAIQTEISMLETRKAIEMETWKRYK